MPASRNQRPHRAALLDKAGRDNPALPGPRAGIEHAVARHAQRIERDERFPPVIIPPSSATAAIGKSGAMGSLTLGGLRPTRAAISASIWPRSHPDRPAHSGARSAPRLGQQGPFATSSTWTRFSPVST
jgi:hypothetical protein